MAAQVVDKPGLEQEHNGRWLDLRRWQSWKGKGRVYQPSGEHFMIIVIKGMTILTLEYVLIMSMMMIMVIQIIRERKSLPTLRWAFHDYCDQRNDYFDTWICLDYVNDDDHGHPDHKRKEEFTNPQVSISWLLWSKEWLFWHLNMSWLCQWWWSWSPRS